MHFVDSNICRYVFVFFFLFGLSFAQQTDADLESLIYDRSPISRDTVGDDDMRAHEERFSRSLSKFEDVNERLLKLAEANIKTSIQEGKAYPILYALAVRKDLSPPQLARVKSMLMPYVESNHLKRGERNIVAGFLAILGNYPSDENEEIAIRLSRSDDLLFVLNALETLGKIGTERAQGAFTDAIQKCVALDGGKQSFGSKLMESQQQKFLKRLAAANSSVAASGGGLLPKRQTVDGLSPAKNKAVDSVDFWSLASWLMVSVGAAGLTWIMLKRCGVIKGRGRNT